MMQRSRGIAVFAQTCQEQWYFLLQEGQQKLHGTLIATTIRILTHVGTCCALRLFVQTCMFKSRWRIHSLVHKFSRVWHTGVLQMQLQTNWRSGVQIQSSTSLSRSKTKCLFITFLLQNVDLGCAKRWNGALCYTFLMAVWQYHVQFWHHWFLILFTRVSLMWSTTRIAQIFKRTMANIWQHSSVPCSCEICPAVKIVPSVPVVVRWCQPCKSPETCPKLDPRGHISTTGYQIWRGTRGPEEHWLAFQRKEI